MTINWTAIAAAAETVANAIAAFAPVAGSLAGPEGAVIGALAAKGAAFVSGALEAATAAGATISTGDLATIKAAAATVQAQNATLAGQIAAS